MSLELFSVLADSSSSTCFLSLWPRDLNFPGENVDSNHLFSDSVNREIYKCQYDKTMGKRINSVHCVALYSAIIFSIALISFELIFSIT